MLGNGSDATINPVGPLGRVRSGSAQNRPASRQDPAHRIQIEWHAQVVDQTAPALHEAYKFVVVVKHAFAHHGADDRIQSRAIAAAG